MESSDVVITSSISVSHHPSFVLFNSSSTYSFVSTYFATRLELLCESFSVPIRVATTVGN